MKFGYLLKESFRGFNSAKLSTFASVITITLSLILITIYYTLSVNSNRIIKSIKDKVELEVFLLEPSSGESIDSLKERIKRIGGVKQITYVSKDEAAKIFEEGFGKEMLDVFEENPLPASIRIALYEEYKTTDRINKIREQLLQMPLADDVVYPKQSLQLIEGSSSTVLSLNLVILIIVTLSSVFLVSNTIRLVISSKKKIIETLKLLGATRTFIRTPYIIEGLIQGLLGGIFAVIILYTIFSLLDVSALTVDFINAFNFLILISIGISLGILGSSLSVGKFLKEPVQ